MRAVLALVAAGLSLSLFVGVADAFSPAPPPLCEVVRARDPAGILITVTITELDGTGCRTARKAMRFCIRERKVKGWTASRSASALINTAATKAIYFRSRPAQPRCWTAAATPSR